MVYQPTRASQITDADSPSMARRALPAKRHGGSLTGTGALIRFFLRRDRIKGPAWLAGLGLYVIYVGAALPAIAPTQAELEGTAMLIDSPVARMWVGPGYGMDAVTYERFFASGYGLYLYILAALMSILLVTRHTRAEEQSGRAELVRASVVGRQAPLTATLILAALTNLVGGSVVLAMLLWLEYALEGSLLLGFATTLSGLAFAGITAVCVQITQNSRAAAGLAGGVLGIAFMVRALGDMAAVGGSALSWFSPLGWPLQTAPYVLDRWWPLGLLAAVVPITTVVAYALAARRDFGAGMLPERRVRHQAALASPLALGWRLGRAPLIGWGSTIVFFALIDGAFGQAMLDAAAEMPPLLLQMFGGTEGLVDGYLAFLAEFSGYLTIAYVVFAAQVLAAEENRGRADLLLATPTSRARWAGSHLVVIALGTLLIMGVAGLVAGLSYAAVTDDWSAVGVSVAAHLNLVPGVLVLLGAVVILFGWAPRLLAPVGWALVGIVFFLGVFAQLMNVPEWVLDLSPLRQLAKMPVEDFELVPVLVTSAVSLVAVAVGLLGLRRRQIVNRG